MVTRLESGIWEGTKAPFLRQEDASDGEKHLSSSTDDGLGAFLVMTLEVLRMNIKNVWRIFMSLLIYNLDGHWNTNVDTVKQIG